MDTKHRDFKHTVAEFLYFKLKINLDLFIKNNPNQFLSII
jgi:hypothetical protein